MLLNAKKKGRDKMIKTFRGRLADTSPGNQERIKLSTIKGTVGYKIVKLQLMHDQPGLQKVESTVKVYKTEQTTIDNDVNFADTDLLAAIYMAESEDISSTAISNVVIFDREIFNQDIYLTHQDTQGARDVNYYIELEVIPLSDQAAEYTTIKDIRTQRQ